MARPARPCSSCLEVFSGFGLKCPKCRARARRQSRDRHGRGDAHYASPRWRRVRASFLRRHPRCSVDGCSAAAQVVDHDPPRAQLVAAGVHDPDHDRWLQGLCKRHHDQKTATLDGGFGRPALDRHL